MAARKFGGRGWRPCPLRDGDEYFTFVTARFNVSEGFRVAAGRRPVRVRVSDLVCQLDGVAIDEAHASSIDLGAARPVLSAFLRIPAMGGRPEEVHPMVIDGHHKIWKANREGVGEIDVLFLTEEESDRIRIS